MRLKKTTKFLFVPIFSIIFLFLTFTPGAFSKSVQPSEFALFRKVPKVFSASRMEESILEAPVAISVITGEQLESWGIVDLPDAFRFVPGMDVTAFNGREWGVTARGFNERFARRMLVLIDGVSVYTPLDSGVPWGSLPLLVEDIDRIEVIRGPNDTLYGFNAFNGVINIKTKEAKDTQGYFGKYTFGAHVRNEFINRYGDKVDLGSLGQLDFRISYAFRENQGYGIDSGKEFADYRHLHLVSGRAKHTFSENFNLEFLFGSQGGDVGQGSFTTGGVTFQRNDEFHYQTVRANYKNSEKQNGSLQFHHWYRKLDAKFKVGGVDLSDQNEHQFEVEAQHNLTLLDGRSKTVLGASYRTNSVNAVLINRAVDNTLQTSHNDLFSVFGNEKFTLIENEPGIHKLSLSAGVRIEGSRFTGPDWAPQAAVLYEPIEDHVFRLSYARAFRLPSFVEELGTNFVPANTGAILRVVGNRNLKREEVNSYEFGYSGLFMEKRLSFDADFFFANYNGLTQTVQLQPLSFFPAQPQILSFNNSADALSLGFELESKYKLTSDVDFFANYSFQQILSEVPSAFTGTFNSTHPEHKANFGVHIAFSENTIPGLPSLKGIEANFLFNYRDSYVQFNDQDVPMTVGKFKKNIRFDMRIARSFFDDAIELAFIAQNLFGSHHSEASFVQVPRLFFGTVTLKSWPWEITKKKEMRAEGWINHLNRKNKV